MLFPQMSPAAVGSVNVFFSENFYFLNERVLVSAHKKISFLKNAGHLSIYNLDLKKRKAG